MCVHMLIELTKLIVNSWASGSAKILNIINDALIVEALK